MPTYHSFRSYVHLSLWRWHLSVDLCWSGLSWRRLIDVTMCAIGICTTGLYLSECLDQPVIRPLFICAFFAGLVGNAATIEHANTTRLRCLRPANVLNAGDHLTFKPDVDSVVLYAPRVYRWHYCPRCVIYWTLNAIFEEYSQITAY